MRRRLIGLLAGPVLAVAVAGTVAAKPPWGTPGPPPAIPPAGPRATTTTTTVPDEPAVFNYRAATESNCSVVRVSNIGTGDLTFRTTTDTIPTGDPVLLVPGDSVTVAFDTNGIEPTWSLYAAEDGTYVGFPVSNGQRLVNGGGGHKSSYAITDPACA